jgi:hypothetical protein
VLPKSRGDANQEISADGGPVIRRPELPPRALSGDLHEAKKTPNTIREMTMCKTSFHSVSGRRPSKAPPVKRLSMKSSR